VVIVDNDNKVIVGKAKPDLVLFPGSVTYKDEAQVLAEAARLEGRLGPEMKVIRFPLAVKGKGNVGKLLVATSLARIRDQAEQALIINIAVLAGALLVMALYARVALGRMVIAPLGKVVDAMRSVQAGQLDRELDLRRRDEIGVLAGTYNYMVRGLRERESLKDAFNRYVSPQVYEHFKKGAVKLTGETRKAVVLFSDIRSFTTLSEQLTPSEVVAMLNEYFTEMVEIVFKHDGFVNKFIGDAIMAIYNVPLDQPDPELRAVKTALEMIASLDRLNQRRVARGQFAIKIGIGVNTGPVVAGNLGHERRLEYTVIGDTVNLAQRLESQTKVAGAPILISQSTFLACGQHLNAQQLPPVKVKGKAEPVVLYAVAGLAGEPPILSLPAVPSAQPATLAGHGPPPMPPRAHAAPSAPAAPAAAPSAPAKPEPVG